MAPPRKLRKDDILVLTGQYVRRAAALKNDAAPLISGLEQEMDLCVVPERLKMSDSLDWRRDRFFVDDRGPSERDIDAGNE